MILHPSDKRLKTKVNVGERYNKLLVIARAGSSPNRLSKWQCQCDCGNITEVLGRCLRSGEIKSCGVCTKRRISVGDRYGKWEVISYSHSKKVKDGSLVYWNCRCQCGREKEIASTRLLSGGTKGCKDCHILDRFGPVEDRKYRDYPAEFTDKLKRDIRKRDSHCCQFCKNKTQYGKLDVHHIDHDRHNNSSMNLVSLCEQCHYKMHGNASSEWIEYWKNFMIERFGS